MKEIAITSTRDVVRFTPGDFNLEPHETALADLEDARAAAEEGSDEHYSLGLAILQRRHWLSEVRAKIDAVNGQVPVYLLAPPTQQQRREFRVRLAAMGADRYPSDTERLAGLRRAFRELGAFADVDTDTAISAIEDAQSAAVTGGTLEETLADVIEHMSDAAMAWPPYRQLMGKRAAYREYAPLIAMQMYLVGWEHGPGEFRRTKGGVPDDVLDMIEPSHQQAIGQQCLMLMAVSPAAAKKSVPPAKSSPALPHSTTATGTEATETPAAG